MSHESDQKKPLVRGRREAAAAVNSLRPSPELLATLHSSIAEHLTPSTAVVDAPTRIPRTPRPPRLIFLGVSHASGWRISGSDAVRDVASEWKRFLDLALTGALAITGAVDRPHFLVKQDYLSPVLADLESPWPQHRRRPPPIRRLLVSIRSLE